MRNIFTAALLIFFQVSFAQVGIGTTAPNKSAALDITSSNKGLLLPRVNDTASVTDPSAGLMIYNIATKSPNFHNGTNWNNLSKTATTSELDSITYTITGGPTGYTNGTFNCSVVQHGISSAGGASAFFQDISLVKSLDSNSTAFAKSVAGSSVPPSSFIIEIKFYKRSSSSPYYSIKLTQCFISSFQFISSNNNNLFEEQITIKPSKIGYKNWISNSSFGWDIELNKPISY